MVCMGMVARVFSVRRSSGSHIRQGPGSVSYGTCRVAMKMEDSLRFSNDFAFRTSIAKFNSESQPFLFKNPAFLRITGKFEKLSCNS